MSRFAIMVSIAKSAKGRYRRIAVVETDLPEPELPKMISTRAKGMVRIVDTWEHLSVGTTPRSAYQRAYAEAEKLLAELQS